MMRNLARGSVLAALLAAAAVPATAREDAPEKPNIVFILADDLGGSELGCYGQKIIRTPHIDRMASEGMRFTRFYAGNAVCAPSRDCLMTGRHPGHAYIRDNGNPEGMDDLRNKYGWEFPGQHPIPDGTVTLAELLKARGYATAAAGKWGLGHVGTTGDPRRQGFDSFYGYYCQVHAHNHFPKFLWRNDRKEPLPGNDGGPTGGTYSQDRFTEESVAFIRANRDRPFFLFLPLTIPHLSIQVPAASLAEYEGKIPEEPYRHTTRYHPHPTPRAGYAAMISHLDRDVGRILALLKELDLDGRTLVLFSSDNGATHGRNGGADPFYFESAGPLRGLKGSLYEGGIRVPMVARWPGVIPPGTTSDHVAAFWDVLPTLTGIAGAETPAGLDGISFEPVLRGRPEAQKRHDRLYWEFAGHDGWQAVRAGDWKAVRKDLLKKGNPDPLRIELYDLAKDPGETTDLAAKHPDVVDRLAKLMKESRTPSPLFPIPPLDR